MSHKKYALLEDGTIEPLYYSNDEPRSIDEEKNRLNLDRIKFFGGKSYSILTMSLKIIKEGDSREELEVYKEKMEKKKAEKTKELDALNRICAKCAKNLKYTDNCPYRTKGSKHCKEYDSIYAFIRAYGTNEAKWVSILHDGYADGQPVFDTYECSNCKEEYYTDDEKMLPNYCPNCGRKMVKEKN